MALLHTESLTTASPADTSGIDESSIDELALSKIGARPLAPRSPNTKLRTLYLGATPKLQLSPAKSVYLETPGVRGNSPVRFKVTVQAEQAEDQEDIVTPSKRAKAKFAAVKVPLKDADESVKRKPGRPRKSDVEPSAIQKRKGTPIRRQSKRLSWSSEVLAESEDTQDESQTSPAKGTRRPQRSAPRANTDGDSSLPKKRPGRPRKSTPAGTSKGPPSLKKKVGRPRKEAPQDETDLAPSDEGFMDEEFVNDEDIVHDKTIRSMREATGPPSGPLEQQSRTSETPSVGQASPYYETRTKSEAFRSPTGPRRATTAKSANKESQLVRNTSQDLLDTAFSQHRAPITEAQPRHESSRASQFDFGKLTPLHEKNTIAPVQPVHEYMPGRSTPRPKAGKPILLRQERQSPTITEQSSRRNPFFQRSGSTEDTHGPSFTKSSQHREATAMPSQFEGSQPSERIPTASPEAQLDEHNQDEELWRGMIRDRDDDESNDGEATPASDSDESDYGDVGEMTGRPMGEATLMQSEDFSMVSLDSLQSVRDIHSSFIGNSQADTENRSVNEPRQTQKVAIDLPQQLTSIKRPSKLKQGWLPESSPGAHLSPNVSMQRGRQSSRPTSSPNPPKSPPMRRQSSPQYQPQPDKVRQTGARLSLGDLESSPVGAAPVSSFLLSNKQPRLSTGVAPGQKNNDSTDSRVKLPLAPHSANNRLPTPNSADKESQNTSSARLEPRPDLTGEQLRHPIASESGHSPAISVSVVSMQSRTPPSTDRGSSPVAKDVGDLAYNMAPSSAGEQLPSSPPDCIAHSDGLEESRDWLRKQDAMERTWQAAKKQLSPPNRPITIPDDQSYSDDSDESEDQEVEQDRNMAPEEDIDDLWQEEASRGSNIDDSNLSNRSRRGGGAVKRKLFISTEKPQSPRPVKVLRTSRPFSASLQQDHETAQSSRPIKVSRTARSDANSTSSHQARGKLASKNPEIERQMKVSSTIANLFKNVTGSSVHLEPTDDTSSKNPEELDSLVVGSPGSKGKRQGQHSEPTSSDRRDSPLSPQRLNRSSQLKRQLSPEIDSSFGKQTNSFVSMASDVQQLRNEMTSSQNLPTKGVRPVHQTMEQTYSTRTTTQKIPVNLKSIDDSIESESGNYDNSALLSLNPKRTVKPLFQTAQDKCKNPTIANVTQNVKSPQPKTAQRKEMPPVQPDTNKHVTHSATAPSMLNRLWTNFPFLNNTSPDASINGPPRPKHRLLSNLPLLPNALPFTTTHYKVLGELWNRYKSAPELFLTSNPQNAGLMTKSLSKFSEARMSEWGYEIILKPSSLILVALFMRLLVLKDAREFEATEGRKLELGLPGELWMREREKEKTDGKTTWKVDELVIGEAFVVMRLFAVMVCESVREDESRGEDIDRDLKFKWKAKGERGWNFSLLVSE